MIKNLDTNGRTLTSFTKKKLFSTWLSTSIAMSMNMSCSSLMDVSNLMMSACLASMSANVCFAAAVSMMIPCKQVMPDKKEWKGRMNGAILALVICTWYNLKGKSTIANLIFLALSCNQIHLPTIHYTYKIFQDFFYKIIIFFTCVKTAGLPCSNMSSNSSLVVVRPAEQKDLVLTGSWFLSCNREENILNRFSLNRLIWFLSSNIEEYILNSQFLGSDINFSAASSTRN